MSGLDERYWHHELWLSANDRIRMHPNAAHWIVAQYSSRQWKDARRTAVCAAAVNTPLWQTAVAAAYPTPTQGAPHE